MEGRQGLSPFTPMTQFEKDLILEAIKTIGVGGVAYIIKVLYKVIQSVSSIPDMKADLDTAHAKIRSIEQKLLMNQDNQKKACDNP